MKNSVLIILFLVLLFHVPGYGAESRTPVKESVTYRIGIAGVTHEYEPFGQLYNNLQATQEFLPFEIVEGSSDMSAADSVRNLIGQDIDGLMLFVSDENVLPTICGLCEEAKMPWGIFLWQIQDEDIRSLCESSPWYIGNTGEREEETGAEMIRRAYFISPIVDMEQLILNMMSWANVTEKELEEKSVIATAFGEDLSWNYLCYVREHPVRWTAPTRILYGSRDRLTAYETVSAFVEAHGAELTVMEDGEHWFHTDGQMRFLDDWIRRGEKIASI